MDIIIIGAGLSGLYSAVLLKEKGYRVKIIEARDRVGGRTYTQNKIDLGGQWISSQQKRIMKLVEKLDVSYFPQYDDGKHIMNFGKVEIYDGNISTVHKDFIQYLNILSQNPQKIKETAKEYMNKYCKDEKTRRMIEWLFKVCICVEADKLPFLFWLYFLRSCGGYEKIADIREGAQEFRIKGGSMTLSEKLSIGLDIRFNEEVKEIRQIGEKCIVNDTYVCDKVIVSIPLQLQKNITYSPPLPILKQELLKTCQMGSVIKIVILYEQPFWREKGYSGEIISDCPPISLSYDCSTDEYYGLVTFVCGKDIPSYNKNDILKAFEKYFGDDRALHPIAYYDKNWNEDVYSGGCYFTTFNTLLKEELQTPFKNVHWIGTETANEWMGYMEGALESAERVVKQISRSLL